MELLELFSELPSIGQAMIVIGFIMPFAVLHTFLNPEPKKPTKPIETTDIGGGCKIETYEFEIKGEKKQASRIVCK